MGAALFLAMKDVLKNRKILLMIILMIGIGVTATLTMSGLFNGFKEYFNDVTINVMTGHLTVFPKENNQYMTGVESIERKIQLLPEVVGVTPRLAANGIAFHDGKESQIRITGLTASKEMKTTKIADKVVAGEFLNDNDRDVLLGSALADTLEAKVGERIKITFRNGIVRDYKIKGFLDTGARSGDETAAYLSNKELDDVLGLKDSASQILVKLEDAELVDKSKTDIMQIGIGGDIKTWKELSSYLETITRSFNLIFGIINIISLTAAAISIAVVMFINVERKTREIGIMKAIGARNSFVMKVFAAEILIYAFLGVLVGNVLAYLISEFVIGIPIGIGNITVAITPVITFSDVVLSSAAVFLVTVMAGIYPVMIATRMDMIKAIWGE